MSNVAERQTKRKVRNSHLDLTHGGELAKTIFTEPDEWIQERLRRRQKDSANGEHNFTESYCKMTKITF